jgi:hypothetical protein
MTTQKIILKKKRIPVIKLILITIVLLGFSIMPVFALQMQKQVLSDEEETDIQTAVSDSAETPAEQLDEVMAMAVACSQTALIDAIDTANANPGADTIELPADCVISVNTAHNIDTTYRENGFPLISSEITINANGASITAGKAGIRGFQIVAEGILALHGLEMSGFDINNAGGAILNQGILRVSHSTFKNNEGRQGGVIFNDGDALVYNSTFTQNSACCCNEEPHKANGGAIFNNDTLRIVNSTFNNNEVNIKGKHLYNNEGSILLENSILATTSTSPIYTYGQNCDGSPITDGGGNLRWPASDTSCVGTYGDPKLAPLADNGGLTDTFALLAGSAAIDAADDTICAAEPVNNTSQNGVTRPHGPHCDIGALELDYLIVNSITRADPDPTNAENVDFTVTFSRSVIGVDVTDFALSVTDLTGASVSNVSGTGATYTVTVNTGSNSGTLRLDVVDDDSIEDSVSGEKLGLEGLGNGDFTSGEVYTVDKEPPVVSSITRASSNPTRATFVAFLVTFSEPVVGVDATDFQLTSEGLTDPLILAVIEETEETYTVNVSTGTGSGTLQLDLIDDDTIVDTATNPLGGDGLENGDYTEGEVYTVDKLPPLVSSISAVDENPTSAPYVDFEVTFSEAVTGVDMTDFTVTMVDLTLAEVTAISGSEETYTVTVSTGVGDGTIRLDLIDDDSILDLAQNPLGGEGLLNGDYTTGEHYTVIDSPIFADVPFDHWAFIWIEKLYEMGITKGCKSNPLSYCPDQEVTRAEMAVFLERGMNGSDFNPPVGAGTVFYDVPFDNIYVDWIEQLYADGITAGCGVKLYCPDDPVTRAQMAIFLLRAKYGKDYEPPAIEDGTGFNDVAADDFAAAWIKQLALEGITAGCGGGNYCPDQAVTRAQMAVFLVRTFEEPD